MTLSNYIGPHNYNLEIQHFIELSQVNIIKKYIEQDDMYGLIEFLIRTKSTIYKYFDFEISEPQQKLLFEVFKSYGLVIEER